MATSPTSPVNLLLEEYKLCEESLHHHERTMWQLLGFYMAVTGILLQFWLGSQPFTEVDVRSNSFVVLFIPLLLGLFTASALVKHRFFWGLERARARELEEALGFERERAFAAKYYRQPISYARSHDLAVLAVLLTVLGVGYLIGRSLWFKSLTIPSLLSFPVYVASIPGSVTVYGAWRRIKVSKEREEAGLGPKIPKPGPPGRTNFKIGFGIRCIAGLTGSIFLGWGFESAFVEARKGTYVLEGLLHSWGWWATAAILLGGLAGYTAYALLQRKNRPSP